MFTCSFRVCGHSPPQERHKKKNFIENTKNAPYPCHPNDITRAKSQHPNPIINPKCLPLAAGSSDSLLSSIFQTFSLLFLPCSHSLGCLCCQQTPRYHSWELVWQKRIWFDPKKKIVENPPKSACFMLSHGSVSMVSSKLCLKDTYKWVKQTHFIIIVFLPLKLEGNQCFPSFQLPQSCFRGCDIPCHVQTHRTTHKKAQGTSQALCATEIATKKNIEKQNKAKKMHLSHSCFTDFAQWKLHSCFINSC